MTRKRIRVLAAKPGLDGHDRGVLIISQALSNAGMEVIYTGRKQTPESIVEASIQEDVDVIGLSILSGNHLMMAAKVVKLLLEKNMSHIAVIVGGFIPDNDIPALKELGVREVFPSGTPLRSVVEYIEQSFGNLAND